MYEVWYDYIKPKISTNQTYVTRTLKILLFILKPKIFMMILVMMLKNGLIHLTMMIIDHFQ